MIAKLPALGKCGSEWAPSSSSGETVPWRWRRRPRVPAIALLLLPAALLLHQLRDAPFRVPAAASSAGGSALPTGFDTAQNTADLAIVLMSEASVGMPVEQESVGWTVVNRMLRNHTQSVRAVWGGYSRSQPHPARFLIALGADILGGRVPDQTEGCTHFYTPKTMPKAGATPADRQGYDTAGGLEQVAGTTEMNYRPGWALRFAYQPIPGVRPMYYKFYRAPGNGPVR